METDPDYAKEFDLGYRLPLPEDDDDDLWRLVIVLLPPYLLQYQLEYCVEVHSFFIN